MSTADSASLHWLSWLYTVGAWGVVLGVVLESAEIFARRADKRKRRKFIGPSQNPSSDPQTPRWAHNSGDIGFVILVFALVIEQVCHQKMEGITSRERDRLTTQLESTTLEASTAIKEAATIKLQSERLREQNLKLSRDLERLRQPRWWFFNETAFSTALKDSPKMDVQIWYPTNDIESAFLVNFELIDALKRADWNITEVREFVPVYSVQPKLPTPFSVEDRLDINRLSIRVSTHIFWETVGSVWNRDDVKTAPKAISKAFENSGICWRSVIPEAYWGVNPIPTNTIRIVIFPKNL